MHWEIDKNKPIAAQICEKVSTLIALGEYRAGEKIASVRETALAAGVNPNTVQRSFEELERQGIIYSVRGSGWFVANQTDIAKEVLDSRIIEKTAEYLEDMKALGLGFAAIKKIIEEWEE
ncbi:MAG: GntR family transcriptional regulator [Clostridia bacterium]|nr:GntR family transcriptional regulator [Clostridia bacterium]